MGMWFVIYIVESELQELLRQYRAVEAEKKSYTEKTHVTVKRQEYVIIYTELYRVKHTVFF
jgi:hypothetical protein